MGFLDRALDVVNSVYIKVDNLDEPTERGLKRGDELLERGERASARITGIERKFDGDTTTNLLALELQTVSGSVRAGTRDTTATGRERLRLGLTVPVRTDGEHAVIDWPALWTRWDLPAGVTGARPLREAPDDGVRERALDARRERILGRGTPVPARITALDHCTMLGMPTENFDVRLRLEAAGSPELLIARDEIPFYATWLAAPGAGVPVVVDPGDPERAAVDWARAAREHAGRHGGVDDPPPPGSAAAALDAVRRRPAPDPAVSAPAVPVEAQVAAADTGDAIEGVDFDEWIAIDVGLVRDRVRPADHDVYAQGRGAPAGRWSAIDAEWRARVTSDWRLGARYGEAYEAARKG